MLTQMGAQAAGARAHEELFAYWASRREGGRLPCRASLHPAHFKRHLRTKYNMSPEDYRSKWGLPKDYQMVAPSYAKARSELAKQMGLGQGGRQTGRRR